MTTALLPDTQAVLAKIRAGLAEKITASEKRMERLTHITFNVDMPVLFSSLHSELPTKNEHVVLPDKAKHAAGALGVADILAKLGIGTADATGNQEKHAGYKVATVHGTTLPSATPLNKTDPGLAASV